MTSSPDWSELRRLRRLGLRTFALRTFALFVVALTLYALFGLELFEPWFERFDLGMGARQVVLYGCVLAMALPVGFVRRAQKRALCPACGKKFFGMMSGVFHWKCVHCKTRPPTG